MDAQAGLRLHLSKCHIVGNHMSRLSYIKSKDDEEVSQSQILDRPKAP